MMDNLEKYIRENRESFDTGLPGLEVWAKIDRSLERSPSRRIVWMKRLRVAASIVVLLAAGGAIGAHLNSTSNKVDSLAGVSPEYAEMERYFSSQVTEKMAKLAAYRQDGFVRGDIQDLDAVYEDLKTELKDAQPGTEEQIIQAMIENYQTKIDILEQVLEKVQTTKSTNLKTEGDEISL